MCLPLWRWVLVFHCRERTDPCVFHCGGGVDPFVFHCRGGSLSSTVEVGWIRVSSTVEREDGPLCLPLWRWGWILLFHCGGGGGFLSLPLWRWGWILLFHCGGGGGFLSLPLWRWVDSCLFYRGGGVDPCVFQFGGGDGSLSSTVVDWILVPSTVEVRDRSLSSTVEVGWILVSSTCVFHCGGGWILVSSTVEVGWILVFHCGGRDGSICLPLYFAVY